MKIWSNVSDVTRQQHHCFYNGQELFFSALRDLVLSITVPASLPAADAILLASLLRLLVCRGGLIYIVVSAVGQIYCMVGKAPLLRSSTSFVPSLPFPLSLSSILPSLHSFTASHSIPTFLPPGLPYTLFALFIFFIHLLPLPYAYASPRWLHLQKIIARLPAPVSRLSSIFCTRIRLVHQH